MQYLLLIYSAEDAEPKFGTAEGSKHFENYMAFTRDVKEKGLMMGSNALDDVATATTVRVREGKVQTVDGPFAETKEQLGGYYLLDCKNLDEAIGCAARIPSAKFGSVEIRPVKIFE